MDVGRLRTRIALAFVLGGVAGCASLFGPTTATSFMKIVETDPDPNVRYKAYQSLGHQNVYDNQTQRSRAAELLVSKLEPKAEPLASRAVICRTLGELRDPVAREAMIQYCHDPDPLVRAEAYCALGKVGRKDDSTLLMQAMALDQDDHCKAAAIEAIGWLKEVDPRTEGYLVRALDNDDPRVRYESLRSLRKISGKDLGAKPDPWRKYVLAKYGEKIDPPALVAAAPGSRDPSASQASLPPGMQPVGPWSQTANNGDMPYLANRPTAAAQPPPAQPRQGQPQQPGQAPAGQPLPPARPTGGVKAFFSKVLGY